MGFGGLWDVNRFRLLAYSSTFPQSTNVILRVAFCETLFPHYLWTWIGILDCCVFSNQYKDLILTLISAVDFHFTQRQSVRLMHGDPHISTPDLTALTWIRHRHAQLLRTSLLCAQNWIFQGAIRQEKAGYLNSEICQVPTICECESKESWKFDLSWLRGPAITYAITWINQRWQNMCVPYCALNLIPDQLNQSILNNNRPVYGA